MHSEPDIATIFPPHYYNVAVNLRAGVEDMTIMRKALPLSRRVSHLVFGIACVALVLAACQDSGVAPERGLHAARLMFRAKPPAAGLSLDIEAAYKDDLGLKHVLARDTFALDTIDTELQFDVPLFACITGLAAPRDASCPLLVFVRLLNPDMQVIDSASVGPVRVTTGIVRLPQISLHEISTQSIQVDRPDLAVGDTVTASITMRDARGRVVATRGLTFASAAPGVATVNSSGMITGASTGATFIRVASPAGLDSVAVNIWPMASNQTCRRPFHRLGRTPFRADTTVAPLTGLYRVLGQVTVAGRGVLTIAPGTTICVDTPNSIIIVDTARLVARGTPAQPIVFTATDTSTGWGGLVFTTIATDSSRIAHARVEFGGRFANAAINTLFNSGAGRSLLSLDTVTVRKAFTRAIWINAPSVGARLTGIRVDTTLQAFSDQFGNAAVQGNQSTRLNDVFIRGSAVDGLRVSDVGGGVTGPGARLSNVLVEGSARIGLVAFLSSQMLQPSTVTVRLGSSYGVTATLGSLARIGSDSLAQARLLGNARDTAIVSGSISQDTVTAFAHLPWRVESDLSVNAGFMSLRSGARLSLGDSSSMFFNGGGRLDARGRVGAPVVITAIDSTRPFGVIAFNSATRVFSSIVYALIEHGAGRAGSPDFLASLSQHRLTIDSTRIRKGRYGGLRLDVPTSRVVRTILEQVPVVGNAPGGRPAIIILGDSVTIDSVEIAAAPGPGIGISNSRFTAILNSSFGARIGDAINLGSGTDAATMLLSRLNIAKGTLRGVANGAGVTPVSALNLWWGDVSGPAGPNGSGTAGPVLFTPWAVVPFALPRPSTP